MKNFFFIFFVIYLAGFLFYSGAWASSEKRMIEPGRSPLEKKLSYFQAVSMDLLIPGGGHFYSDKVYEGIFWTVLKGLGGYAIYINRLNYRNKKNELRRAQNFDLNSSANGDISDLRRKTERASLHLWFAVFGQMSLFTISLFRTASHVSEFNRKFLPEFKLTFDQDGIQFGNQGLLNKSLYSYEKIKFQFYWEKKI